MAAVVTLFDPQPDRAQALPLFRGRVQTSVVRRHRTAERFLSLVLMNRYNDTILSRLPELGVEAWLASGCLVQTVWNVMAGRAAHDRIGDYDLIYFDRDRSWEAEDAAIRRAAWVFQDLPVRVEVRNQARVHLWYPEKYKIPYPALSTAHHSLLRYPTRTSAVALTKSADGRYRLYAPFGLKDAMTMRVRPNKRLPISSVYRQKAQKWRKHWPMITVEAW